MIARAPAGYKKQRLKGLDRLVAQKAARRAAILTTEVKPAPPARKRRAKRPLDPAQPDARLVMVQLRPDEYDKLMQRAEANDINPELYLLAAMRFAMESEGE